MIQIDDSGSGSFVGGTCIGIYRRETNEYYFDIIPVELYNKENFKSKRYLDEVVSIVSEAFKALNVCLNETIEICRGYMFERLKHWLSDQGYFWYGTQITGRIQDIVEKSFELYSINIGLPESYIKYTQYPFHFHKLLRWVFADYDNRISLCKTGWKSWSKIEAVKFESSFEKVKASNLFCLKCGKDIKKGSNAKVLSFKSGIGGRNYIYIHADC